MSLWFCAEHGLYGGQVFCPRCGGTGSFATFGPAQRIEARSDETPAEAVQPAGQEPGPKDAPKDAPTVEVRP